jgi:hypothetical protein
MGGRTLAAKPLYSLPPAGKGLEMEGSKLAANPLYSLPSGPRYSRGRSAVRGSAAECPASPLAGEGPGMGAASSQ